MKDNQLLKKVEFSEPIEFWAEVLMTLDKKIEFIKTQYGYGRVNMSVIIQRGQVFEVVYTDEVRTRKDNTGMK